MKKNFIYALMSAIALTGAVGLSSCTDEEVVETNPNFNPETNEVVTQFVLNIATDRSTRQSSETVQASGNFRGISSAKLYSFNLTNDDKLLFDPNAADATIKKAFDLSEVASPGTISESKSSRVLEMSLPLKTNTLVFYGKAPGGTSLSEKSQYGFLESHESNNSVTKLSDLTFTSGRVLEDATLLKKYYAIEDILAGVLTSVMSANLKDAPAINKGDYAEEGVTTTNKYNKDVPAENIQSITWKSYMTKNEGGDYVSPLTPTHAQYPLEEKLRDVYEQMTTIVNTTEAGELRAASGTSIIRMIRDLWTIVNEVRCALPISEEEAVAKCLAVCIDRNLKLFFNGSVPDGGDNGTVVSNVSFNGISTIIENLIRSTSESNPSPATSPSSTIVYSCFWPSGLARLTGSNFTEIAGATDTEKNLSSFPSSFNMPSGATYVVFDNTHEQFVYPKTFNTTGVGNVDFNAEDYLYAPELIYFGNSPIRSATVEKKISDFPNTVATWTSKNWADAGWSGKNVQSTTRSVAMTKNINYGNALLKSTVGFASDVNYSPASGESAEVKGKMFDNNHAIQLRYNSSLGADDEKDKEIEVDGDSFVLTGVLVGGQSRNVGWNLLAKAVGTGSTMEYGFVYDKSIVNSKVPTPSGGENYTLLFDNFREKDQNGAPFTTDAATIAGQDKVYVALEFTNNSGTDFFGNFNLIRDGGTFYLIGELDPQKAGLTKPTWPSDRPLPPYKLDTDNSIISFEVPRVFMQDYMTTVNFKLAKNSLKYAYLTVPDLRSTSLTLGLSVDIQWSTGINFGDVPLGSNTF